MVNRPNTNECTDSLFFCFLSDFFFGAYFLCIFLEGAAINYGQAQQALVWDGLCAHLGGAASVHCYSINIRHISLT